MLRGPTDRERDGWVSLGIAVTIKGEREERGERKREREAHRHADGSAMHG